MSRKTRYKFPTNITRKTRDKDLIATFSPKQVSIEKNKRGELFILFTLKTDFDVIAFERHADKNQLKYERL